MNVIKPHRTFVEPLIFRFQEKTYEAKLYHGAEKEYSMTDHAASFYTRTGSSLIILQAGKSLKLKNRLLDAIPSEIEHANEFQKGYHEAHKTFCIWELIKGGICMRNQGFI